MSSQAITICSLRHADVWSRTASLLPEMVDVDSFTVFVPESEVAQFRAMTNRRIDVQTQESLSSSFCRELSAAVSAKGNQSRYGWYAQQYMKIEALRRAEADSVVIWDGDCVPVSPVRLFDLAGRPIYMEADEYHAEYFRVIDRLLGLSHVPGRSFVIPGFPMRHDWVRDFLEEIEVRHSVPWYAALIDCTDFSQQSGFSETETLGTWVAHRQPDQWSSATYAWERFGSSRFGVVSDFTVDQLTALGQLQNLDIISFESWDKRGIRSAVRRVRRALRRNGSSRRR